MALEQEEKHMTQNMFTLKKRIAIVKMMYVLIRTFFVSTILFESTDSKQHLQSSFAPCSKAVVSGILT